MIGFGSFDDDGGYVEPTVEGLTEQIHGLHEELRVAHEEIVHLNNALVLLKQHMAHFNVPAFGHSTLDKKPSQMSREELITRNKEVTERSVKRVHTPEATEFPSYEDTKKMYENGKPNLYELLLGLNGKTVGKEELENIVRLFKVDSVEELEKTVNDGVESDKKDVKQLIEIYSPKEE